MCATAYLWNPARDVCIEIEILLDGRHQDKLADKSVVWCGGGEVGLKYLNYKQCVKIELLSCQRSFEFLSIYQ